MVVLATANNGGKPRAVVSASPRHQQRRTAAANRPARRFPCDGGGGETTSSTHARAFDHGNVVGDVQLERSAGKGSDAVLLREGCASLARHTCPPPVRAKQTGGHLIVARGVLYCAGDFALALPRMRHLGVHFLV